MRVAIIGAGISGLCAAYYLHRQHDITLYELAARIGGHTATIEVEMSGGRSWFYTLSNPYPLGYEPPNEGEDRPENPPEERD